MEQPPLPAGQGGAVIGMPLHEVYAVAAEYERAGRIDDAERLLQHILAAQPQQPDALHLGGIVAFRRGRTEEAVERLQAAVQHGPDTPLYLRNLCEAYRVLGRLDDALAAAEQAVALAPGDPVSLHNLSVIHYHRLEPEASLARARQAIAINPLVPGPHFAVAEAQLLLGEWEEGWAEYEWRFRFAGPAAPLMPPTDKPQWDGMPLPAETLLLIADQGFGDVIQFMRYIPWVAERCPNLVIACSLDVASLVRQVAPAVRQFMQWKDCPPYAAFIPLSGLPRLHGTRVETVPWSGPYLRSDPARRAVWAGRLAALLPAGYARIGIVWAGRPTHSNDRNRSLGLPALRALGNLPGVVLVSIQKGDKAAQTGAWFGRAPLIGLGPEITDYDDTMAILDQLDLLISVDTSVAHLAGAMGRPTWLLLPHAPDWRWLLDREDTPWYPRHRLIRQAADRSWTDVMAHVTQAVPPFLAELRGAASHP